MSEPTTPFTTTTFRTCSPRFATTTSTPAHTLPPRRPKPLTSDTRDPARDHPHSSQLPLPAPPVPVAAAGWGSLFAAGHELLGQHQLDIVEADSAAPAVIATVALLLFARPTRRGRRDRIFT